MAQISGFAASSKRPIAPPFCSERPKPLGVICSGRTRSRRFAASPEPPICIEVIERSEAASALSIVPKPFW